MKKITKVIVQYYKNIKMWPSNELNSFKKSSSDEKQSKHPKVLL